MAGKSRSPGPAAEAEKRAAWVALPAQGVSNSEVCWQVGVCFARPVSGGVMGVEPGILSGVCGTIGR